MLAPSPRLSGYLRLTCAKHPHLHRPYLSRRAHRPPIHISKPYFDGHYLLLNVMSPTAGLLEGDDVAIEAEVASGASLVLSHPTSLRAHKMGLGHASWNQRYTVDSDALLESNPEWLILQAQSRLRQTTRIELGRSSELLFLESIAPGRVAHGEAFAFSSFRNRLELSIDGQLVAKEAFEVNPRQGTHLSWQRSFASPFYVSLYFASPRLAEANPLPAAIHHMGSADLLAGYTQLPHRHAWNARFLSPDPSRLRQAIAETRAAFYQAIGRPLPSLRR